MTTDRWQRTHELFDAALALPEAERGTFLAKACGEDEDLRKEVESLIKYDTAVGEDFLGTPPMGSLGDLAWSVDAPEPPPSGGALHDPLIGRRIGRYHVKSLLAEGGMARIYEAVQEQPHRVVALKVMKRGVTSRPALRRFEFESQVLGRLRHPGVAQVYEAGTQRDGPDVVPYFAMEYVPGARPITEYAAGRGLDLRERLELFAAVCDAVDHGHTKGVIHRDLKPTNILVNPAGEPKVIDFGVARATDSDLAATTQQTFVGQLVGTVQYMSPEQCGGDPHDIDTRSDVYSLGVVLYELLVGRPPYDASTTTLYQAIRVVREQEPDRPSAVDRKLRGDPETIVLKALAKERAKRYQSAAALGADIRRYLRGDPIEARPPTAWTRTVRWVGRHLRLAMTLTSAAFVAATLAATWVSVWFLRAQPYDVVLAHDRKRVDLVSFTGRPLHSWLAHDEFKFAKMVKRPPETGSGELVLIGYPVTDRGPYAGQLCAFDVAGDRSKPIWSSQFEESDLLPRQKERGFKPEELHIHRASILADVFKNIPGEEIVAIFSHRTSARLLCIYDLTGNPLYSFWHDGPICSLYWMDNAQLLVCAVVDDWERYDEVGNMISAEPYPRSVFAVRPKLNSFARNGYVKPTTDHDDLELVWYRRVIPEAVADGTAPELSAPSPPYDPGRHVDFVLVFDSRRNICCSWTISDFGAVGRALLNDPYHRVRKLQEEAKADESGLWLPDPSEIKLVELPLGVTVTDVPAPASRPASP